MQASTSYSSSARTVGVLRRAQGTAVRAAPRLGTAAAPRPFSLPCQRTASPFSYSRPSRVISNTALPVDSLGEATMVYQLAGLDPSSASTIATILSPVLTVSILMMLVRIVLTWFPEEDSKKFPWVLVYTPTEPVLGPTRKVIPPVNGVDISPIVWLALLSFLNEILLGPQGILNLMQRQIAL